MGNMINRDRRRSQQRPTKREDVRPFLCKPLFRERIVTTFFVQPFALRVVNPVTTRVVEKLARYSLGLPDAGRDSE